MKSSDLRKLARTRLKEAKILHSAGFYDGCIYLSGYVLELALKAKICSLMHLQDYPDEIFNKKLKSHNLTDLVIASGLSNDFSLANPDLFINWNKVVSWKTDTRYNPIGQATKKYSEDFLEALENPQWGVFTWIKKRW